jgi:hypothetical protein
MVLVGKSYINGYGFLKGMNSAAVAAAANIKSSGFLDKLATDLVPDTSPELVGLIALDLIQLALGFIPVADLGVLAPLAKTAIKQAVKQTKKLVESTKKSDQADLNALPSSSDLSTQLDGILSGFQQGITDSHADIFNNAEDVDQSNPQASDLFSFVAGGVFLGIDLNPTDMQRSVEQGMKNYLIQSVLNSTGCQIFHETAPLKDGCAGAGHRLNGDGSCDSLLHSHNGLSGPNNAAEFQANPGGIYGTLTLDDILDNAIACAAAGGSVTNVDIDAFLENGDSIPACFFGFPVMNMAPPLPQDKPAPVTSDPKGPGIS